MSDHPGTARDLKTLQTIPNGQGRLRDTSAVRLVGRDRERGVLAGLLGALPRRGGALVLRGEPGIGKSALLAEAAAAACRTRRSRRNWRKPPGGRAAAAFRCHWSDLGDPAVSEVPDAADRAGAAPDDPLLLQVQAYAAPLERGPAVLGHLARVVPPDDPEELYLLGTAPRPGKSWTGSGRCVSRRPGSALSSGTRTRCWPPTTKRRPATSKPSPTT